MRDTASGPGSSESRWTPEEREWARKRVERKRKLAGDFVAYILVTAFLAIAWAVTGRGGC